MVDKVVLPFRTKSLSTPPLTARDTDEVAESLVEECNEALESRVKATREAGTKLRNAADVLRIAFDWISQSEAKHPEHARFKLVNMHREILSIAREYECNANPPEGAA